MLSSTIRHKKVWTSEFAHDKNELLYHLSKQTRNCFGCRVLAASHSHPSTDDCSANKCLVRCYITSIYPLQLTWPLVVGANTEVNPWRCVVANVNGHKLYRGEAMQCKRANGLFAKHPTEALTKDMS